MLTVSARYSGVLYFFRESDALSEIPGSDIPGSLLFLESAGPSDKFDYDIMV